MHYEFIELPLGDFGANFGSGDSGDFGGDCGGGDCCDLLVNVVVVNVVVTVLSAVNAFDK